MIGTSKSFYTQAHGWPNFNSTLQELEFFALLLIAHPKKSNQAQSQGLSTKEPIKKVSCILDDKNKVFVKIVA